MDPAIIVFGFGVGFLVGLTGMGGGSLMTPLLILVFGIKPVTAIGTDIFYAAITKMVGAWRHLKLKTVKLDLVFWMALGSVPAAIAGVWVIEILQGKYGDDLDKDVFAMLAAALIVVGVATLVRGFFLAGQDPASATTSRCTAATRSPRSRSAPTTGFIIGVSSAGSGTLIAMMLIALFRLTPPGRRHRHRPRRDPAHRRGGRPHDRRQRRLRARGQHPRRLDPRRLGRQQALGPVPAGRPAHRAGRWS